MFLRGSDGGKPCFSINRLSLEMVSILLACHATSFNAFLLINAKVQEEKTKTQSRKGSLIRKKGLTSLVESLLLIILSYFSEGTINSSSVVIFFKLVCLFPKFNSLRSVTPFFYDIKLRQLKTHYLLAPTVSLKIGLKSLCRKDSRYWVGARALSHAHRRLWSPLTAQTRFFSFQKCKL